MPVVLANGGDDSMELEVNRTGTCNSEALKKDVRGLMLLAMPSFLRWALLPVDVRVVQLASPPKASLTSILHTLKKRVLDASELLTVLCTSKNDKIMLMAGTEGDNKG